MERLKKLEIELEEMMVAKDRGGSHTGCCGKSHLLQSRSRRQTRVHRRDASLRKEKQEMRKEQENITKNRAERHNLYPC